MAPEMYQTFQDGTIGDDTKDLIKREKKHFRRETQNLSGTITIILYDYRDFSSM